MWGMIAKISLLPGERDEMIAILKESAADMHGCLSYIVAKDAADENTIWVTEVWDSMANHDESVSLPAVKSAIPRAKAIVSNFEKIAVTQPVWGVGDPSSSLPLTDFELENQTPDTRWWDYGRNRKLNHEEPSGPVLGSCHLLQVVYCA